MGLRHLVLDFNGTLAAGGALLPGVRPRLVKLARLVGISVLTADTFGTAQATLRSAHVSVRIVRTGQDKSTIVLRCRKDGVVVIGNGNNDVPMFRRATLRIAVLGPEGMAPELLEHADVVVPSIRDALDLLLDSKRLTATLRR